MATLLQCHKPLFPLLRFSSICTTARTLHLHGRHGHSSLRTTFINPRNKNKKSGVCRFGSVVAFSQPSIIGESRVRIDGGEVQEKSVSEMRLYNTMSREKEVFKPKVPGKVGMYVCGVTAYDLSHIGHARVYVSFDVLYRYLKHLGYDVCYIRNFTDVDDKDT